MVIGDNVAGFINNKARSLTRLLKLPLALVAEVTAEKFLELMIKMLSSNN